MFDTGHRFERSRLDQSLGRVENASERGAAPHLLEEFTLTQDRGRQRGNDMSSPLETAAGPNEDIGGDARSSQRLVGEATAAALGCRVVRHEHHEIVVAVFVRIAACDGAKQIDTVRSVSADETL